MSLMNLDIEIKDMNTFKQMKPLDAIIYFYQAIIKYETSFRKDYLLNLVSDIPKINLQRLEEIIDSISKGDITEPEFLHIIKAYQFKTANIYSIYERYLKKYELISHMPRPSNIDPNKPGEKWGRVFDRFDGERTGYITLNDVLKYFQMKKIDIQHIPRKDLSNAFAKMDADKSRGASREQFINYCMGTCSRAFFELVNRAAEVEGFNKLDNFNPSPRNSESRKTTFKLDLHWNGDRDDLLSDRTRDLESLLMALKGQLEQKMRDLQSSIDSMKGNELQRSVSYQDFDRRKTLDANQRINLETQETLKIEINDLQNKINQLTAEANDLRALNTNFSFSLNDYMLDKDKALDDFKNDFESKKIEIEKLLRENERLNNELEEKERAIRIREEEILSKEENLTNIKERLGSLEQQLNFEKAEAQLKVQELQKSIDTLNQTLQNLQYTNQDFKSHLDRSENEKKILEIEIKDLRVNYNKTQEKLQTENLELQRQLNQINSKSDELYVQNQTLQKLKEDSDNILRQTLQEKEKQIITLKNEMQSKLLESKRVIEEKSDLQSNLKLIQGDIQSKDITILNLEKERDKLRNKIENMQSDAIEYQTQERQKVEKLKDDLQTSQTTIENLLKDTYELRNQLNSQKLSHQDLEHQLALKTKNLEESVKESTSFVHKVEVEKKMVEEEISNLRKEYQIERQRLQDDNNQLIQNINRLESNLEDMKIKNQTLGLLKDEADKILKKSLEEKEKQLLELKNELQSKATENKRKIEEISDLKIAFQSKQEEIDSREEEIIQIRKEKKTLEKRMVEFETEIIEKKAQDHKKFEKLQHSYQTVQILSEKLQRDLNNAHSLVEKKQLVIEELENKYLLQKKYYDDIIKELRNTIENLENEKKKLEEEYAEYKKSSKEEIQLLENENSDLNIIINQLKSKVEEQSLTIQTITKSYEEAELILKASLDEKEKNILELKAKVQKKNAAILRANADSNEAAIILNAREQDIRYRDEVISNLDSEKNTLKKQISDFEIQLNYYKNHESEKVEKLQTLLQTSQSTISNIQKEYISVKTQLETSNHFSDSQYEEKYKEAHQILQESLQKFSEYKEAKEKEVSKLKTSYEEKIKELEISLSHVSSDSQNSSMNNQSLLFSLKKSNELLKVQLEETQKLLGQLRAYSIKNDEIIVSLRKEITIKVDIISRMEKELNIVAKPKFKLIEGSNYKSESELIFVKATLDQKEEEIAKLKAEVQKLQNLLKMNQTPQKDNPIIQPMISPRTMKLKWPGLALDQI